MIWKKNALYNLMILPAERVLYFPAQAKQKHNAKAAARPIVTEIMSAEGMFFGILEAKDEWQPFLLQLL
ncbi:hypothetical protein [Chitinophaga arvensicola]|uniref:hypothetical protein n=1 Tax=Chitinophaga arvensicola TaxID=29529 RepID=UPI000B7F68C7|nr:hypothetical protein [Chitinophaga arvensicola]